MVHIITGGDTRRRVAKKVSSYYSSCPKCGATDVPHATIGVPCPSSVAKRSPQPSANDEYLARLAFRAVNRVESLELLAKEVGTGRALQLRDRAQAIRAAQERGQTH